MFNEDEILLAETKALQKLKFYREEQNLSQFELSLQSGVSQNMITYIETGKRSPTLKTIIKLCNALGISPAKLFDIDDKEKEETKRMVIEAIKKIYVKYYFLHIITRNTLINVTSYFIRNCFHLTCKSLCGISNFIVFNWTKNCNLVPDFQFCS